MTNNPFTRAILVRAALGFVPPLVRMTLLEDPSFREEYGLHMDVEIAFDGSGFSFQRSALFEAIRNVLSGTSVVEVIDSKGQKWFLENHNQEGELSRLVLSCDENHCILPDFSVLSPDRSERLRSLDMAVTDLNLSSNEVDAWRKILTQRPLKDEEFDAYQEELRETPNSQARAIRRAIVDGLINIGFLVPSSLKYYQRLVGDYDGSNSIHEYAVSKGRTLFDTLLNWRSFDGFLFSLFLSSHSSLMAEIQINQLSSEDLRRAYDYLEKHGDRTSQLGAIEVGFRVLPSIPEIEPVLIRLIEQIRDDDVEGNASGFKLLSALFILVDGELSRARLLSAKPPFYRRLAALAQSALIHRLLLDSSINLDQFCSWASNLHFEQFFLQSLTDMRLEPRWNPYLATGSQMKAEFIGRIMNAARQYEQNITGDKLYDLVLSDKVGSLSSHSDIRQIFPGPLEGSEESGNILPSSIIEEIEMQLNTEKVEPSSFTALVNLALFFSVGAEQAELAARVLQLGNHRLENVEDRLQLMAILNGLATVAAATRSSSLANELRILARIYRHDAQFALSVQESMGICLLAAASRANLTEWCEFVGEWLTELAFSNLEGDDDQVLLSHLRCLCHAVPELWVTCGRADAALIAYNSSRNPACSN